MGEELRSYVIVLFCSLESLRKSVGGAEKRGGGKEKGLLSESDRPHIYFATTDDERKGGNRGASESGAVKFLAVPECR